MSKPSFSELFAFELNIETAVAVILKAAGLNVVETFIAQEKVADMPDEFVTVQYEAGATDDQVKGAKTDAAGNYTDVVGCGWEGDLVITHRVAMDDSSPPIGEPVGAYQRLCRQRGHIRALILGTYHDDPFKNALPWYSILSIVQSQPDRRVDSERSVNQATERFRMRFMPKRGAM